MNEVKSRLWQWIGNNIVLPHLNVLRRQGFEKSRIDVSDEYTSLGAHAIREPRGDRASSSHLQAMPALAYSSVLQMADCAAIIHARQSVESRGRLSTGFIESLDTT